MIPKLGILWGEQMAVLATKTLPMQRVLLGDALFSKTQQKLLALLFGKPDQSFFTNEIMRSAQVGRGSVVRELERMLAAGLITLAHQGNQNHYQANPACPIFNELIALVRKTFGIADVIKAALRSLNAQITASFIYGSVAKGEAKAESDVDLMLIGEGLAYAQVMECLASAEQMLGRTINPTIYTAQDFSAKLTAKNSFLVRVLEQPRIHILGEVESLIQ